MPWHITKTSILSSAVPTDGTMYKTEGGNWSNVYENRKIFDTKNDAKHSVERSIGKVTFVPKDINIVEE